MKKASEFCKLLEIAEEEKWGYVWGLNGEKYTKEMAENFKKTKRSPPSGNSFSSYWTKRCAKWYQKNSADCSGLIVWAMRKMGILKPNEDMGSATLRTKFVKSGSVSNRKMPEKRGIGLYRPGHIAVYMGNGVVLEAKGTDYGVVKGISKVSDFKDWGLFNGVDYSEEDRGVYISAKCNGEGVHIRSGAGVKYASLRKVAKNEFLKAKNTSDKWLQVQVSNNGTKISGYMYSKYVDWVVVE